MGQWTIDFMSRTGIAYHIAIDGKAGDDMSLTPAAEPFVTQEEGDEDLFVPVRTQSGSIRVVTDDAQLIRNIIPDSGGTRKVSVTNAQSGVVVWKGYVQPKMLSMRLFSGKQVVSIPVECGLAALKYRAYNYASVELPVSKMLAFMLTSEFSNFNFNGYCFENQGWLHKKVKTSLFVGDDKSHFDVLSDLCAFFGWTCRSMADSVVFAFHRNVDAQYMTEFFSTDANVLNTDGDQNTPVNVDRVEIDVSDSGDDEANMIVGAGVREAVVRCSLNSYDQQIEVSRTALAQAIDNGTLSSQYVEREYTEAGERYKDEYWTDQQQVTVGNWKISSVNARYYVNKHDSYNVEEWEPVISAYNTYKAIYDSSDPYNPWLAVDVFPSQVRFVSVQTYTFGSKGKLTIKGASIGKVVIGGQTFYGSEIDIPAGGVSGTVDIRARGYIKGLSIEFKADADESYTNDSDVEFRSLSGSSFSEVKNIDTVLCVKQQWMRPNMNNLLNADGSLCEGLSYGGSLPLNPLQVLADEAAAEGSRKSVLIEFTVRREMLSSEVTPMKEVAFEQDLYWPVAISHDWREDMIFLKLVGRYTHP